jgi:hypothetical protein
LSSVEVSERVDWNHIIGQLSGASAAMTVKAAQDAAKATVLRGEKIVTESQLLDAVSELKHANGERNCD